LIEDGRRFLISTQVLNEYYSAMLKNRVDERIIQQNIETMIQRCEVRLIDLAVIRSAHTLKLRYRFSYWDSLVIATALDADCKVLYSEDLQDGQQIEGSLRIVNPLATQAAPCSKTQSGDA
jgi:predicted nucleic acid-binding protein